jgi:flagellar biosynthesis protein FlhF
MQLRKFYGRTPGAALLRVKRELGPDALILETRPIPAGSMLARLHPDARYEVCAAREAPVPARKPAAGAAQLCGAAPPQTLLEELGQLRAQIRMLMETAQTPQTPAAGGVDLADYRALLAAGIDHRLLAPHFRSWLAWRTSSSAVRRYLAQSGDGIAARMQGESLSEWVWLVWRQMQGLGDREADEPGLKRPRMVGLVGPTGGGKSTALAKLSSKYRQSGCQNIVILTLDTQRIGATDQWRRWAKLIGIEIHEVVTPTDLSLSMESWDRRDWVGIDTPGGMTPESKAGELYGSILARCPHLETVLTLPVTQDETVCRFQMDQSRPVKADKVLFTKLDESPRRGTIVNLTLDGAWKIDGFCAGTRVPQDWEPASGQSLWRHLVAGQGADIRQPGAQA